jgi:hypothetical protein
VRRNRSEKQDKKLADDARLLRWWKAWHREQREVVLGGPHGVVLAELFRAIKNLQHVQPSQLIGLAQSIDWATIDHSAKCVLLHEINSSITHHRERCGVEPISDNLFDEPDTPFRVLKAIIFSASPQ